MISSSLLLFAYCVQTGNKYSDQDLGTDYCITQIIQSFPLYFPTSSHLLASYPDHIILHFCIAKNKIAVHEQNSEIGLESFLFEMFLHCLMPWLYYYYYLCRHRHPVAPASLKSINNVDMINILHIEASSSIGGSVKSPKIVFDLVCRLLRDNASMQATLGIAQTPAVKKLKSSYLGSLPANNINIQ